MSTSCVNLYRLLPRYSNSFSSEFEEEGSSKMKYRVSMLGMNDTGKTALVSQFLTSEYMNTYDASLGEWQGFSLGFLLCAHHFLLIFLLCPGCLFSGPQRAEQLE